MKTHARFVVPKRRKTRQSVYEADMRSEDDILCRKCAFTKRTRRRSKKVVKAMKNTQKFQTRNEGLFYKCLNKFMKTHELYVVSGLR